MDRNSCLNLQNRNCGAEFSPDRVYRYFLWRQWDQAKNAVCFIGLNPSTADELEDDRTIGRCICFARDWGFGGIRMVNLFSLRATDPKEMKANHEPIGSRTDEILSEMTTSYYPNIVCAWGNDGAHMGRSEQVLNLLFRRIKYRPLQCFGLTKKSEPKHPLYLRADARIQLLFPGRKEEQR
jgi:hypothetical protein